MGGELVISLSPTDETQKKPQSMTELFWEAYPAYLTMGMPSEEYWHGDARACRAYRKARKENIKLQDELLWRQGLYVYHALCCVAPYFNSIKPRKPEEYIKPFIWKQEHTETQTEIDEGKQKREAIKRYFMTWCANRSKIEQKESDNGDQS